MSLQTDLSAKIDASALVTVLLGKTAGVKAELDTQTIPASSSDTGEASRLAATIDLSTIGTSVLQVGGQVSPALAGLANPAVALEPITNLIAILEQLTQSDLEAQFQQLADQLSGEVDDTRRQGFVAILIQISDLFGNSPQAQILRDLANAITRTAGVDLPADAFQLPELAQATAAAVRVLGGLISLETILAEAERLTGVMQQQLDTATIESRRVTISGAFASVPLTTGALLSLETDLQALKDLVAQGMGFGEATLVYLDFPHVQSDLALAATMVRETDLSPLERTLSALAAKLAPILAVDLSGAPARSLDQVLQELESRTADLAQRITAFDVAQITEPLTAVLTTVTDIPNRLTSAITEVTVTVRGALERLRDLIQSLPFDTIGNAVRTALQPVVELLNFLTELLNAIKQALQTAVVAVRATLGKAEAAVDEFKAAVEQLFKDAKTFIEGLNLDAVIGNIADGVQAFADVIARAQMKPYFDAATGAIDTATGVVENVPFSLIPDSMEQEVVDAVRPVKTADLDAFESEIKNLLQIGPDGKFQLRPDVENSIKTVQEKYDALIVEVRRLDPQKAVEQIDNGLKDVIARIEQISPQVELAPVQQALDQLRSTVNGFDLNQTLKPLTDAFMEVLAAADRYAPGQLLQPLEQRVDDVREKLIAATRLSDIAGYLDQIREQTDGLVTRLDPVQLQPIIRDTLDEGLALLNRLPQIKLFGVFGNLISSMLAGMGLRVGPQSFDVVLDYFGTVSGTQALARRADATANAVRDTKQGVIAFDPQAFAASLAAPYTGLRTRVNALPAGPLKADLTPIVARLDPALIFGPLVANRTRYLAELTAAETVAETGRRTGYSEVDVTTTRLRVALGPFDPASTRLRSLAESVGLSGFDVGFQEVMKRLFAVATPERLTGLVMPVFGAIRNRAMTLLDSVLLPLKKAVQDIITLINAVDLTPLREAVDQVYQQVRTQIASLSPEVLLADVLTAFRDTQQQVAQFNPLAEVQAALTELRDTTTRVLSKLKAAEMLATPLAIYEEILDILEQLNIEHLMTPILDQIDAIAEQVNEGLTETVDAFQRLQDALPDRIGSTEVSASVSVG